MEKLLSSRHKGRRNSPPDTRSARAPEARTSRRPAVLAALRQRQFSRRREWLELLPNAGLSLLVHAVILGALWFVVIRHIVPEEIVSTLVVQRDVETEIELVEVEMPTDLKDLGEESAPTPVNAAAVADVVSSVSADLDRQSLAVLVSDIGIPVDVPVLHDIAAGRSQAARAALVEAYGGNAASEEAVAAGLRWLASVQREDGSWSFTEIGESSQPGTADGCEMGATGAALLAFLGAGHTQEEGDHQEVVRRGLDYLLKNTEYTSDGADLRGGAGHEGMYVQGLAAIPLCEAYAMTGERVLRQTAADACWFIVEAQDPRGGGWRYRPGQSGDTSVVGWQMMALQSGRAARLRYPDQDRVYGKVNRFLNSVDFDKGAQYGYRDSSFKSHACTAIGLLCRMYVGWQRDYRGLRRGIAYVSRTGPSDNDMYYNYYATQVLHHWGGPEWRKWNAVMRDQLIARQAADGLEAGSWAPGGSISGRRGGRLFETCLSVMTLEVYYRYLPLYDQPMVAEAVEPQDQH